MALVVFFGGKKGSGGIFWWQKGLWWYFLVAKMVLKLFSTKSFYAVTWEVCACAVNPPPPYVGEFLSGGIFWWHKGLWWHFMVAKRALVAFFGGMVAKRLFGAHFGAKKALWCTFLG